MSKCRKVECPRKEDGNDNRMTKCCLKKEFSRLMVQLCNLFVPISENILGATTMTTSWHEPPGRRHHHEAKESRRSFLDDKSRAY